MTKTKAPFVPAAFINAIAEEGTKEEAVKFLQEQWNETCQLRSQLAAAEANAEHAWIVAGQAKRALEVAKAKIAKMEAD